MFCDCKKNTREIEDLKEELRDLKERLSNHGLAVYKNTLYPRINENRQIFNDFDLLLKQLNLEFINKAPERLLIKKKKSRICSEREEI